MTIAAAVHRSREARIGLAASRAISTAILTPGAIVLRVPQAPRSPMLNRIVGLGVERPATEADVDEALDAMGRRVTFYVAVAPSSRPARLTDWLRDRGLAPGWGWMSFGRSTEDPVSVHTTLRIAEVADAHARAAFARVVRVSYDLPEAAEPWLATVPERGWRCWIALDGDEAVGAAGLFAAEGTAYLGLAGTLPAHRGRGAQNALLAARVRAAAEHGCDLVVTETGERHDDRPSGSYRNILRAGFRELGVTANWHGQT